MKLKYALGTLKCAYFSFRLDCEDNLALIEIKRITVYVRVKLLQMSCNDGDGCPRDVEVIAHYEMYDGLPLTAKWIEVSVLFAKILAYCKPCSPMCGKLLTFLYKQWWNQNKNLAGFVNCNFCLAANSS